jgi:hypothetical protein
MHNQVPVDEIRIVVEPWCSDDSWLKVVVRPSQAKLESAWTVRQINSVFVAKYLSHYRPKRVTVEFKPPCSPKNDHMGASPILRAKLFDVGKLFDRLQTRTQERPVLEIRL